MTHPVFNLKLKSILPAALSLLLPALCWAGVPSALPNRALKIDLRPQNFKNLSQAADPLSGYRQNPYQGDTRADSLWFNKGMLEEMGQRHEVMAKLREDRQHHFQQTNTDERNYVTEGENMVGNYIKRVFRRRLLSIGDSFKRRFGDGFKDKSKEERIAKNQTEITVTHVAVVSAAVGNGSISKGKIKNKIVVSKQEKKTDEDINIGRAIEAALKDVVRIGRNIVERDQPIEFSDETEARLKFDLPRTTMRVNFNSPVLNADAQYRIGSGTMPFTGVTDPVLSDRASVGVHRHINEINLGAGVRYGVDSSTVSYSVFKQIHGPLSAAVSHNDSLKNNAPSSTMVHLNVGVGF